MALIFKVKYQDTLRRWIASEIIDNESFSLTLQQVELKIKELFNLSPTAVLTITYVDKENDIITLADDKDLIDACLVQRLNPLRLEVQVRDDVPESSSRKAPEANPNDPEANPKPAEDLNFETYLNAIFPEATADVIKQFLRTHASTLDLKLPLGTLLQPLEETFKQFLERDSAWAGQQKRQADEKCQGPSENAKHHKHDGNRSAQPGPGSKGPVFQAVHHGVQCDLCGVQPIRGTRYKSMKIHNYDLCSSCFGVMGNESDYQKMEHPGRPPFHGFRPRPCYRGPRPFVGPHPGRPFFARGPYGWKPECPFTGQTMDSFATADGPKKLDARFVKHVTIFDGTELAPGTKFTKIWRMRNSGTVPIPEGTQLMHIGGDVLSSESATTLELSEGGLPCGEDVDASVDLVAPDKAGRYISYWRLASPSGQKFGHRVWVEIQVVPQDEQSPQYQASLREGTSEKGKPSIIDIPITDSPQAQTSPMEEDSEKGKASLNDTPATQVQVSLGEEEKDEGKAPLIDVSVTEEKGKAPLIDIGSTDYTVRSLGNEMLNIHLDDRIVNGGTEFNLLIPEAEKQQPNQPLIESEVDGFSVVKMPSELVPEQSSDAAERISYPTLADVQIKTYREEQLKVLESMGFMNRDLNVVLLEKNNDNMQQTLDDLLVSAGWDQVLRDLEEMGFDDQLTNIRLVVKNGGSLKRTVKDLVDLEKTGRNTSN